MILKAPYYHGIIRKTIIGFGQLFTGMEIVRKDGNKKKVQTIKVPIAYGPKEKWLRRVEENPDGKKNIAVELPRMAFEIVNYQYDPARKVGSNVNKFVERSTKRKIGTPVPYNLTIALYIIARTQEDSLQIVEQILPYFAPGLTVGMEFVDSPSIKMNTVFTLDGVQIQDNWDGDFDTPRFVTHMLTFTAKIYLFGPPDPLYVGQGTGDAGDGDYVMPIIIKRVKAGIGGIFDGQPTDEYSDQYVAEINPFTVESQTETFTVDEFINGDPINKG